MINSVSLPPNTKVTLKKNILEDYPSLRPFVGKVYTVSTDPVFIQRGYKVYVDANGGFIHNSPDIWAVANPIWLNNTK